MNANLSVQLKKCISKFIFVIRVFGNSISNSFKAGFISVAFQKSKNVSVRLNTNQCHAGGYHMASLLGSRATQAYFGEATHGQMQG